MTAIDPTLALIQSAAELGAELFALKMANSSLDAAIDVWTRRVAQRKYTPTERSRLLKAVERGTARETKEIQLTRAALLRAVGLEEGQAAAAAAAAGATTAEIGAVLGISRQGASLKIRSYRDRSDDGSQQGGAS
ncbi:Fis family transcriptional regulator [Mycobacterium sp. DBP42]|uniref:Fis family transcriptional regulator n=1 Tax=Mycobacteriaceae TaxID=1762 RepID=UPI00110CA7C9|nr:Fis family transcriptional regulator [Mycobacterium sp. DBP42]TMS50672.1 Fis family transcriptional regulator [Mycobacterium sp. DBP42]